MQCFHCIYTWFLFSRFREKSSKILKLLASTSKDIKQNLDANFENLIQEYEATESQVRQEIWENHLENYKQKLINEVNNLSVMEDI